MVLPPALLFYYIYLFNLREAKYFVNMNNKYDSIINLPHHMSKKRPQMPLSDRAAQFLAFAALTGYDSAIKETARYTDVRPELDEPELALLDRRFQLLSEHLSEEPLIVMTCFVPDARKSGGAFTSIRGVIDEIDESGRIIIMRDGTKIKMDDVLELDSELFQRLENRPG